jgi:hypothetical protein
LSKQKRATWAQSPKSGKRVGITSIPDFNSEKPVWQVGLLDLDGPFAPKETYGWRSMTGETVRDFLDKLRSLETMTWAEIMRPVKTNHAISTDDICPEAQARLEVLGREACDTLYSLGPFGNLPRLLGIREGPVFKVVWWDPEHRVCPSTLKHS